MADVTKDQTLTTAQKTDKAIPVAVEPTAQDEARKEQLSKYITDKEALQLFRNLQVVTGKKFPEITTSKGELLQLVDEGNSFFLCHNRSMTMYNFDGNGKYTHTTVEPLSPPNKAKHGIKSQELLREIKKYVSSHRRID